ncbi:hypothetical protein [Streptomyces sp. NPDC001380]|uniref:hypothetical protein n=1 Tax=Streptomyces sp. NPDC001380 TaxID=3364566 RepID=UPI00368631EC
MHPPEQPATAGPPPAGLPAAPPTLTPPGPAAVPLPAAAPAGGPAARPRRLPRVLGAALAATGLLAVTATAAAVTVAVGRPAGRAPAAQAAPAGGASAAAGPSAAPSPSPSATGRPAAAATGTPSASPTPRSTVTGRVSAAGHTGDLRFFLLPVPGDAEVYGAADGTRLSLSAVAASFGNTASTRRILGDYGFRSAAYRTYRTADGKAEVTVRLIRFGSTAKADWFVRGISMRGTSLPVSAGGGSRAFLVKPREEGGTGSLVGLLHQGDVEAEITVQVKGDPGGAPNRALLNGLMRRQYQRLRTGR